MTKPTPELIDAEACAKLLSVSERAVREWIETRHILERQRKSRKAHA